LFLVRSWSRVRPLVLGSSSVGSGQCRVKGGWSRRAEARRSSIVIAWVATSIWAGVLTRPVAIQRDARPDVVIVLTDQQRADAFGAGGATDVATPTMDRLAREGVQFARAFAATPQCSPSRAALITGRHPHRTGVMGNTGGRGQPAGMSTGLDRSIPTMGRVFAAAGYDTAYFGKWHLGGTPGDYGFETHDATIGDNVLAGRVAGFLKARANSEAIRPLFLIVSWLNPHDIYGVLNEPMPSARALAAVRLPANLVDDLKQKPFPQRHYLEADQGMPFVGATQDVWRRYRAFYNGLVETVDREIGTVLAALPRRAVPPVTIFTSDHGDLGGAHGLPFKGPAMYEELVRVPLVISWPGRIRAGRSDALVSLLDMLPTLAALTGLAAPAGLDGLSLQPLLDRRADRVRDMVFSEYYGKQAWRVPIRMVRTERWKYVRYLTDGEELYDLQTDPGELRNLARAPAAAAERTRLAGELDAWIRRTGDPFPRLTNTDRSGLVRP
jgi:arylsulfatase A-like enzyme